MNQVTSHKLCSIIISAVLFCAAHGLARAQAVISWTTPAFISGDADVAAVDTRIWAYNFGNASVSPVVNGVTFTGYASNTGNSDFTLTTVDSRIYQHATAFGSNLGFYTSLSSAYQNLLRSATYWSGSQSDIQTMTLLNLTPGAAYQIQFWVNDARAGYHDDAQVSFADTFGNTATLTYNNGGASLGQYVVGTFTATGTTQILNLGPYSPQINAATLGLVAIPEVSSSALILGAASMIGLALARRRRPSVPASSEKP